MTDELCSSHISYIPRDARHDAIQFDGFNRDEICKWLGIGKDHVQLWLNEDDVNDLKRDKCYLVVDSPILNLGTIKNGHWILIGKKNRDYVIMSHRDFKERFEEI
jgi:hypothetical protein